LASVAPGTETQFVELLFYRGNDSRVSEADLVDVVAVKVEIPAAFDVLDPCSLG
jgi:hypothetical protein